MATRKKTKAQKQAQYERLYNKLNGVDSIQYKYNIDGPAGIREANIFNETLERKMNKKRHQYDYIGKHKDAVSRMRNKESLNARLARAAQNMKLSGLQEQRYDLPSASGQYGYSGVGRGVKYVTVASKSNSNG